MLTGFSLRVIMLKNGIERFFMKKLLSALLVITFALFFVGCSSTVSTDGYTQGSEWIEVKSITYHLRGDTMGDIINNTKIRFLSDGSIEIQNADYPIIRILPLSYKITYLPS